MTVTTRAEVDSIAMSKNEVNYGYALLALGLEFDMQYQIGMPGIRGSQRIDFVVWIAPQPAAIFIQGAYWHDAQSRTEDQLKQAAAEQRGFWVVDGDKSPPGVSEADSATLEAATAHARRNLL